MINIFQILPGGCFQSFLFWCSHKSIDFSLILVIFMTSEKKIGFQTTTKRTLNKGFEKKTQPQLTKPLAIGKTHKSNPI